MVKTRVYPANHSALKDPQRAPSGITYYLPRRRIKLTVQRQPARLPDLKKIAVTARESATTAAKKTGEAKEKAKRLRDIEKQTAKGLAKEKAEREALLAEAEHAVAQAEEEIAKKQLETAELNVNVVEMAGAVFLDKITMELLPTEPDPSRVFVARLDHSFQREDDLKVTLTESGLLKSVSAETTDRTPDALVELAKTLVQVAKLASGVPTLGARTRSAEPSILRFFTLEKTFDPHLDDLKPINQTLADLGTSYRITVRQPLASPSPTEAPALSPTPTPTPFVEISGLVYPRALPYRIEVEATEGGVTYPIKSVDVLLPNGGPLAVVEFSSGAAVTNTYGSEFVDGILVKRDEKRPSELLGVVRILPTIAKEIVSIPTEVVQFKVDYASKEEALLKAQKTVIDAQAELDKAQPTPTPAPEL